MKFSDFKVAMSMVAAADLCKSAQDETEAKERGVEKYSPPMDLARLKAKYPYLYNDPVHRWRAETNIELIHEEPDWDEYQRIQRNWQLMTPAQKAISDTKSVELFGVDNMTNANRLWLRMALKRLGILRTQRRSSDLSVANKVT